MGTSLNSDIDMDATFKPRWARFGTPNWYLEYTWIIKGRINGGASAVIHPFGDGGQYRLALHLTSLDKPDINHEEFYYTVEECKQRGIALIKQEWGLS